jgi:hypothetical protein
MYRRDVLVCRHIPPQQMMVVYTEELKARPHDVLPKIHAFIGECNQRATVAKALYRYRFLTQSRLAAFVHTECMPRCMLRYKVKHILVCAHIETSKTTHLS